MTKNDCIGLERAQRDERLLRRLMLIPAESRFDFSSCSLSGGSWSHDTPSSSFEPICLNSIIPRGNSKNQGTTQVKTQQVCEVKSIQGRGGGGGGVDIISGSAGFTELQHLKSEVLKWSCCLLVFWEGKDLQSLFWSCWLIQNVSQYLAPP